MNSENSKTSGPHRKLLNLTYKIKLMLLDQILASIRHGKNIQKQKV